MTMFIMICKRRMRLPSSSSSCVCSGFGFDEFFAAALSSFGFLGPLSEVSMLLGSLLPAGAVESSGP
jgi:hypothetical protein